MKTISKFKSIKTKSLLIILLMFILTVIPTLFFIKTYNEKTSLELSFQTATIQSKYSAQKLISKLDREIALALKMADSTIIKDWINDENNNYLKIKALKELDSFRKLFADQSYFIALKSSGNYYFNDSFSTYLGNEKRYTLQEDNINDKWFYKVLDSNDKLQINIDHDHKLGVTKVWLNIVVYDKNLPVAVLGTGLDLSRFINEILDSNNKNISNFFIDNNGYIQAHKNIDLIDYRSISKESEEHSSIFNLLKSQKDKDALKDNLKKLSLKDIDVSTLKMNFIGTEKIIAISYIDKLDWFGITILENNKEQYQKMFQNYFIFSLIGLMLFSLGVILFLNKYVINPVISLNESVAQIENGNFNINPDTSNKDEISHLGLLMKNMAIKVGNYTNELESEVQKRTEELDQRVKEEVQKNIIKQKQLVNQSRSAAMGDMMGAILHQWKQPLNAISISNSAIEMSYKFKNLDEENLFKFTKDISTQVKNMNQTMEDFRNFFKPQNPINYDLNSVILNTINLLSGIYENDNIKIYFLKSEDNIAIYGYPNEFQQVLINIFNNAKDQILLKNASVKKIFINLEKKPNYVMVNIYDCAGGIPNDIIDNIFDVYFTTKSESNGTGIGLDMCKTILEKVNGNIKVENITTEIEDISYSGAKFIISLPIQ